jgi:hypothetical protein
MIDIELVYYCVVCRTPFETRDEVIQHLTDNPDCRTVVCARLRRSEDT